MILIGKWGHSSLRILIPFAGPQLFAGRQLSNHCKSHSVLNWLSGSLTWRQFRYFSILVNPNNSNLKLIRKSVRYLILIKETPLTSPQRRGRYFHESHLIFRSEPEKGRETHSKNNPWDGSYTVVTFLQFASFLTTCPLACSTLLHCVASFCENFSGDGFGWVECWRPAEEVGLILSPIFTHHRDGCGYLFPAIFTVIESNLGTTVFCIRSYLCFVFHLYTSQIYLFFASH